MHFDFNHAIALASFTAPALNIEAKPSRFIAPRTGFLGAGKQLAHGREDAGIGRRVGARCATNRALVNVDTLVKQLHIVELFIGRRGKRRRAIELCCGQRIKCGVDQR